MFILSGSQIRHSRISLLSLILFYGYITVNDLHVSLHPAVRFITGFVGLLIEQTKKLLLSALTLISQSVS